MARCSDLPPELIALIISFHRGPPFSLRQYSLVCRAWLSPSQQRLFHTFRAFNLVKNIVPFRDFLLGAPHLGAYVRELAVIGPFAYNTVKPEVIDFVVDASNRKNVENLLSLLPNITKIDTSYLASSPFLFTNSLLRQCPQLRKFSIAASIRLTDVVSPTAILPIFRDTTVKSLDIRTLNLPSAIDSPLDPDAKACSVERLTLNSTNNLSVWFPYFRGILPNWRELKIMSGTKGIPTWSDVLRANNLSHLRRLHVRVSIYLLPEDTVLQFPHDDASPIVSSAPNLDHLLLTTKVTYIFAEDNLSIEVIVSMVEWYLCNLTVLSRSKDSTLRELSLTVLALDDPTVAAAWAKIDNILSTNVFGRFRHIHFVDEARRSIKAWSNPEMVTMLNQILPKLSRAGKLALAA